MGRPAQTGDDRGQGSEEEQSRDLQTQDRKAERDLGGQVLVFDAAAEEEVGGDPTVRRIGNEGPAMRSLFAAVALPILAAGCLPGHDLPPAEAGVAAFHRQLNSQDFAGIYQGSGPDMKKASTQADMVDLFSAIHRKLGTFRSGAVKGWNDRVTLSGRYVTLSYVAKYDQATANETFVWRVEGESALLSGYYISCNYLIVH